MDAAKSSEAAVGVVRCTHDQRNDEVILQYRAEQDNAQSEMTKLVEGIPMTVRMVKQVEVMGNLFEGSATSKARGLVCSTTKLSGSWGRLKWWSESSRREAP